MGDRGVGRQILGIATFLVMLLATAMVFLYVPFVIDPEMQRQAPTSVKIVMEEQKIFYFHVATAWVAFLAFFVVFILSILYLKTRKEKYDTLALISAEIGVLFTTLVLITGPIWGKAAWNHWWDWNPRLTTTLILWFIYLAYLIVRQAAGEEEKKARYAAIFGIVGFLDVPIVYMSIHWWNTIHPVVIDRQGFHMEPSMIVTLLVSVAAFTLLYSYLMHLGVSLARAKTRINELKEKLQEKYYL